MSNKLTPSEIARNHMQAMYKNLCRGIALIAFLFPLYFLATAYVTGGSPLQTSISAYYHSNERDVLVGVLWAVGSFLILFPGYTKTEYWCLKYAGAAAICIATFEVAEGGDCTGGLKYSVHGFFAGTFFLAICIVCLRLSSSTLNLITGADAESGALKTKLRRRYWISAAVMAVSVAMVFVASVLSSGMRTLLCELNGIFWVEAIGIWGFSLFWFSRTEEVAFLARASQ